MAKKLLMHKQIRKRKLSQPRWNEGLWISARAYSILELKAIRLFTVLVPYLNWVACSKIWKCIFKLMVYL